MKHLIRIQIAKILLVSMLFTQSGLLQPLGAVIVPSGNDGVEKDIVLTDTYILEDDIPESSVLEDHKSESETSETEEDMSERDESKEESLGDEELEDLEDIEFEETESVEESVESNQKEPVFTEIATPSNVSKSEDFILEEDFSEDKTVQNQQKIPSIIATPSNAYKSKEDTGVWDGISEKEVIPTGNIYNIQQPEELAWVRTVTNDGTENFAGKTLMISNDLDMGGYEWEGIGNFDNPFMGSVDGNNCTISGIKQENQTSSLGMFGVIEVQNGLAIRNLIIENIEISGNATFAGILAGYIKLKRFSTFNIENVETSGTVDVSGCSFAGGLVGNIYSPNNADINIKNIKTSGDMTILFSALNNSVTNTGGLIGCYDNPYGNVNIKDSSSTMNIDTTAQNSAGMYTGGIFGSSNGGQIGFNRVYATGVLKGQAYDKCIGGGLIGSCETNELKINNSYMANLVEMNGINGWAGGLVGFLKCKITYGDSFFRNCHVSGELKARQCAAFIVQNDSATESVLVDYCYYNKSNQGLNTDDKKITNLGFLETTRIDCPNGYGIVDSEMEEEFSFVGWDFDNVWVMQGNGYPELQENVSLYEGLIAGMDSEEIVYSNLKGAYETEEFDLNYGYQIDGEVISEEWMPEAVLAQVKITLPEGFSFSREEQITEMYVNDGEAPLDYVYVLKDKGKNGKVKVFVNKELERKESFRVRISISAEGFETDSSYNDMSVVVREERPPHVPEEAVYNKWNGHWYYCYEEVCSWEEALDKCIKKSGYLVTITSGQEQSFIKNMLEDKFNNRSDFNNAWIGLYNLGGWQWVSEEIYEYDNWRDFEANKVNEGFLYGILSKNYQWDFLKDGQSIYICEWELKPVEEPVIERPVYVPQSAIYNEENGHWYQYFSDICTWQEAKGECERQSGYLVTITSENEKNFLEKNMTSLFDTEEGLCWIGLYCQDEWKWVTDERTQYKNWLVEEQLTKKDLYYATILKNQSWKAVGDLECPFICEWGNNLDLPQKFPDSYELPVLSEKDARNFLGFVFNKSEITKMNLNDDELFQLMTGKIKDPELQFYVTETLLFTIDSQISNHIGKSSQAKKYLLTSLESFMKKQLDGMKDIPQKEYNTFYNSQLSVIQNYVYDCLGTMVGKYLNIHITETTMEEINLALSTYKKISDLPKKIESFIEKSVAVVQTTFLPLQGELNGRYSYFNSYLAARELFTPKDQAFRTIMDAEKVMLKDDNFFASIFWWLPWVEAWDKNVSTIEEWAEYTYQLQLALRAAKDNCIFIEGNYKNISVQCPVNIFIEDKYKNVIAKIEGDEIVNNDTQNLFLTRIGDEKIICIKDIADYKLRIIAVSKGDMSYICKDIRGHEEIERHNYYELPLSTGDEYISNNQRVDEYEKLIKIDNGNIIEVYPNEIIKQQKQKFSVNVEVDGQGMVSGSGIFTKGDYVSLEAYPFEGCDFLGWKREGKMISKERRYDFTLFDDIEIMACFSNISESGDINDSKINKTDKNYIDRDSGDGDDKTNVASYPYLTELGNHLLEGIWRKEFLGWRLQILDTNEYAKKRWAYLEKKWYLFDKNGYMIVGWAKVMDKWYYLHKDGAMAIGWIFVDNKWYYLNPDGSMATGWVLVNDKWYYLSPDGSMLVSTVTPDGYKVGEDGAWIS